MVVCEPETFETPVALLAVILGRDISMPLQLLLREANFYQSVDWKEATNGGLIDPSALYFEQMMMMTVKK